MNKTYDWATGSGTATKSLVYIVGESTAGVVPDASRSTPPIVAGDQAYYWTRAWQEDEAEARAEIAAGNARRFSSPGAAIRWLLDEDNDD